MKLPIGCDNVVDVAGVGTGIDVGVVEQSVEREEGEVVNGVIVVQFVEAEAPGAEAVAPAGEPGTAVGHAEE